MITKSKNKMQKTEKTKKKVDAGRNLHVCIKCGYQKITISLDSPVLFFCPRCGTENKGVNHGKKESNQKEKSRKKEND